MRSILAIIAFVLLLSVYHTHAQRANRIKYRAEKLTNAKEEGIRFKKLLDKVVFKQQETIVYCDSAYFFQSDNIMEAYGKVRIKDGDSVTITAKKLIYKGNERMALLRDDVVYRRGTKVLYTDILDYNMTDEIAEFKEDGKLVDENNTLTGKYGSFHSRINKAYVFKDVVLVAPDYNLRTDTLEYSTITQIAITKGPTYIDNKDGTTVHADGGTFRTAVDQTIFKEGTIETKNYILVGDHIFIDDLKRFYTTKGNVVMTSKKDDVIIVGDEAVYDKQTGIAKVYGDPLMKRVMMEDTLFMSADTLVSIEHADKDKERILAYYKILFFKQGLQGKCDSMAYFLSDSTMYMYHDPILWNDRSQMEADTILLTFQEKVLREMNLRRQSFLTSLDTLGQHNQIKGRNMQGFFDDNANITSMDVNGNGESHYFVLEGDSLLIGMNKMFCSNMTLRFSQNQLDNITFYKDPEAKFIPPHELLKDQVLLDGFTWRVDERPALYDVATYYPRDEEADALKKKERMEMPVGLPSGNQGLNTKLNLGDRRPMRQRPEKK